VAIGLVIEDNCRAGNGFYPVDPALNGDLQIQEKAEWKGRFAFIFSLLTT
jgi:hypothetical protein